MYSWLRLFALTAALLGMPLQGVAVTLSPLFCGGDLPAHLNGGPDFGTHQNSDQNDGGASGNSADHPCHNSVSAPPVVASLPAAPEFPVRAFAPDTLYDPFIPEQPQRPPLV